MEEKDIIRYVQDRLFELQDLKYREFQAKLMPTVSPECIIGVRTPALRKFAKEFGKTEGAKEFLRHLPHRYYEENNLHGFLVAGMKDYEQCVEELDRFLPFVDNWATCDITACGMKALGRDPEAVLPRIDAWLADGHTYTVRFGVVTLLAHYLGERFDTRHLDRMAALPAGEYYIDMAVAWAFSVALVKHYDRTLPYFTERRLDRRVHNKALQKGCESLRIDASCKAILQRLKY